MMSSRSILPVAVGVLLACATHTAAEPPAAAAKPARLTASVRSAALQRIKAELETSYVFPEQRPRLIDKLDRAQKAGRYDVDDAFAFAERITDDIREVTHDHHLQLFYNPTNYAAALAPPASDAGADARERREAIRDHFGLVEQRRLPGNLRYLKIAGFEWAADEAGAAYDDAFRFLKDGDAVIIDLRGNGGGEHDAVQYLVSHFLAPGTLEVSFLHGGKGDAEQVHSLAHVPGGRLRDKPLYVLIDGRVGSAAEAFAYDVQQFKLGELVGKTTAGAANNNKFVPIAPAFVLSVSFGRPVHAVSHTNWEGVGIKPTIEVDPADALEVAELDALTKLAQARGVSAEAVTEYAWARTAVEARLHPPAVSAAQLAAHVGHYGDLEITSRDGVLWMHRINRPEARLRPLTPDGLFAVDGSDLLRVHFVPTGAELLWPGQPVRSFARQ